MNSFDLRRYDIRKMFYFCCVGALSAAVYLITFTLTWKICALNYKIAVTIAYFASIICHFTANRRFTFQSHGADLIQHLLKYSVMVAINYLITLAVVHVIVEDFGWSPFIAVIISIGSTVFTGYAMAKFWVFKKIELTS